MGGKDAIIVDNEADLELARTRLPLPHSASPVRNAPPAPEPSCTRTSMISSQKVIDRSKKLVIGSPSNAEAQVGPVIDDKAYRKILDYIEIGKSEGRLVLGGFPGDPEGISYSRRSSLTSPAPPVFPRRKSLVRSWPSRRRLLRRSDPIRQQYRLRADRCGDLEQPRAPGASPARLPCRQPVFEPEMHRRLGRHPPVRRLQYVRDRFQSRRARLPAPVHRRRRYRSDSDYAM